jgi:UPF0148 protein
VINQPNIQVIPIPEKKPDDVMAEYLLKGAKMLSKTCPVCGSPMFTYKDRTFCVLCELENEKSRSKTTRPGKKPVEMSQGAATASVSSTELASALETTLITLSERIACEPDPDRCLSLMNTVKKGIEALKLLSQP